MPRGGKRAGAGRRRKQPAQAEAGASTPAPLETLKPAAKLRARGKGDELSVRERLFVDEYLIDLDASAAYLRAGFKGKPGKVSGLAARLIARDRVAAAIQQAMAARAKRVHVDQDRVLLELARIGFADLRNLFESRADRPGRHLDVLRFYREQQPDGADFERLPIEAQIAWTKAAEIAAGPVSGGFFLKSPDNLDDSIAAAIAGVEVVTKSIGDGEVEYVHKIKTVDKLGALTTLAKHLGMLNDAVDHKHSGTVELAWLT